MNIHVSKQAASFYKKEMELPAGAILRLYVRVGGVGSGGFSVGIMREEELNNRYYIESGSLYFTASEDDFWYLDGMTIDYDADLEMIVFQQPRFADLHHPLET